MKAKDFIHRLRAFSALNRTLPILVGEHAKNFFIKSFKNQGFEDNGVKKWQARKGEIGVGGLSRIKKKTKSSRAILIGEGSGNLMKSIRIESASMRRIKIVSDVDYAKIHNEGLMGKAWGKHPFKMPKRQFIGKSATLNREITDIITKNIKKALLGR